MLNHDDVFEVVGDMCQFGMTQHDDQGEGHVKEATRFMTNSWEIAKILRCRCDGSHRHIQLVGAGRRGPRYIRANFANALY